MTDTRKEIELLIKANFQGKKDLASVPKTIDAIEQSLKRQVAAAEKGENSIDELKASLMSLKDVQSVLTGSAGLIGAFQKLSTQITTSEQRVVKSGKAYDEYSAKVSNLGVLTEKQQDRLIKLATAQERSTATLGRQREQYQLQAAALKEAGIATDQLAEAETKIRTQAAQLGVVINQNQQAIANYADTVRKARTEEKARADEAKANATKEAQATAALAAQRQKLFAASEALAKQTADAKDAFSAENALQAQARAAQLAARGYSTLAKASSDLKPKVLSLREALSRMTEPASGVTQSLTDIGITVQKVSAEIAGIKGPVKDYQATLKELKNVQASIGNQAALIDNYRKEVAALRESRSEMVLARAAVQQYAAAVAQGGSQGASFTKALADAEVRARAASIALGQQVNVTRQVREEMARAGVSAKNLGDAERQLSEAARGSVSAIANLSLAVDKYGTSVERAKAKGGMFGGADGERTTLNFAQRLRGQILSLTAAYVGLFGVVNEAKAAITAMVGQETVESRIAVALESNDPAKIGKEYEYLRGRADYYGVGVQKLAESYGSYAIAAKSANFTSDQTKFTFEQLTAGMRVLKMNTDQQGRAWTQLNQIMSKAKPEMEDIKTIAESGFAGIQGMMARGLLSVGVAGIKAGSETSDMFALMKKGALDSGQAIYALATQAQKELGGRIPQAIKTLQAEQGRFETALFEFQKQVANSGWADSYKETLKQLAALMQSEDGEKGARAIGQAFSALAQGLIAVLANLDTVKTLSMAFIAVWVGAQFAGAITGLIGLSNGVNSVGTALTTTQKSLVIFQALIAGWAIGTIMYEKFKVVRDAGAWLVTGLDIAWTTISHSFQAAVDVLPAFFTNAMKNVVNSASRHVRLLGGVFAKFASAVGLDGIAGALTNGIDEITLKTENTEGILAARRAALQKDLDKIRAIRKDMLADDVVTPKAAAAAVLEETGAPGLPKSRLKGDDEAAAKKHAAAVESITKSLEQLATRTSKAQEQALSAQLDAVDTQYAALSRRIKALGGKEGAEFAKQFAEGIASLKGEITDNFNKKLSDEQERLRKKLEDADAAAGRKQKVDLGARLDAVTEKYAQTYREIAELQKKLEGNGRDASVPVAMKARLDAGVQELKNLETKKFYEDEMARREKDVKNLLDARANSLKTIKDLEEASLITTAQANAQREETITTMQPQIEALTAEAVKFAETLGLAFDPAKIQQFVAAMQLANVSGGALNKTYELTAKVVNDKLANGLTNAADKGATAVQKLAEGQISFRDAIKETGVAFLQFAADFMREIAMMIAKRLILKALESTSWGAGIAGLVNGGVKHSGGLVGGTSNRSRMVPSAVFANAPRYHQGGMAGLRQDEYATILQKNEEVLTSNDPRNVLNGGGKDGGSSQPQSVRFVLVDDQRRVAEAMQSAEGEQAQMVFLKNNAASVKQILGVR